MTNPHEKKQYPPELIKRIEQNYEAGLTQAEVGKRVGLHTQTVRVLMHAHGIPAAPTSLTTKVRVRLGQLHCRGHPPEKIAAEVQMDVRLVKHLLARHGGQIRKQAEQAEEIAALYASGLRIEEIADRIGLWPTSVCAAMRNYGIPIRSRIQQMRPRGLDDIRHERVRRSKGEVGQIYRFIEARGDEGATDDEMDEAFGFRRTNARRNGLTNKGLIVDSGKRRMTRWGRPAAVWVVRQSIAEALPPPRLLAGRSRRLSLEARRLEKIVLDAIRESGAVGATDDEVVVRTGLPRQVVVERRHDLAVIGTIESTRELRSNADGRPFLAWRYAGSSEKKEAIR